MKRDALEQARSTETTLRHRPSLSVFAFSILFSLLLSSSALAHEVRPAYLELRQTGPEAFDVLWKVPGRGENLRLGLYVELPPGCTTVTDPRASMANNAFIERRTVECASGLTGGTIHIAGLAATTTDVLARLERLDGTTQTARLTPSAPSFVVEAAPHTLDVARTYLVLGVEHILAGIDHLLFVLALLFLVQGWRRILATVTAFTLAHSLTLAAATLGFVHVPQKPVEAVIALSIVFVAAEILRLRRRSDDDSLLATSGADMASVSARWPWIVAFTFGLLHGFGFAGALSEVGLPQKAIPVALLFFNVGVEMGQLMFIGAVFAVIATARWSMRRFALTLGSRPAELLQRVPPYAIGSVAMFWVIQRVAAF